MGSVTFAKSVIALTLWHEMVTLSSNSGRKGCWKLFPSHLVLFVWGTDRIWPILNQLAIMRTSAGCSMGPRLGHEFSVNRITLIIMGARWGEKWSSFEKKIHITRRIQISGCLGWDHQLLAESAQSLRVQHVARGGKILKNYCMQTQIHICLLDVSFSQSGGSKHLDQLP